MTAAASAQPAPEAEVLEFMKVWNSAISEVIGQIAGTPLAADLTFAPPPDIPAADQHDLQMKVVAAGGLTGEMGLRVPKIAALSLGQLFMQEAQDPAAEAKPDHNDALTELLRQVAGQVATGLTERWGEVQLRVESSGAPSWSAGSRGWLVSAAGAPCRLLLEWQLSSALIAALRPVAKEAAATPAVAAAPPSSKLDLLMDVELDVTLRFGQRSMTLREIMELDAGSIVELDRQVQEPAELLLEGKLIARGEVVVVDGNYGLRVLEIVSASDRR